jgi:hypothetical protein
VEDRAEPEAVHLHDGFAQERPARDSADRPLAAWRWKLLPWSWGGGGGYSRLRGR